MPTYRLFRLNEAGKYAEREEMNADDDDAAMQQARAVGHAFTCELWLGRRLVGRIVAPQG